MPKRKTVLDNKNLFSPVDIEKWFGISRTTLFRWENENRIPEPSKDKNGARMYERRHLIRIAEVEKDRMKRELERR
ncbi:MAG: hypothetical protein WAU96_04915, partial [Anaerolineae bacterium]